MGTIKSQALRVGVDVRILQGEDAYRGIGHYTRGLTEALLRLAQARPEGAGASLEVVLFWDATRPQPEIRCEGAAEIVPVSPSREGRLRAKLREWGFFPAPDACALDGAARKVGLDVLHVSSPLHGPFEWSVGRGLAVTATVYDLIPKQFRSQYLDLWPAGVRERYGHRLKRLGLIQGILAISETVKRDLVEGRRFSPDRVQVAYPGLRACFLSGSRSISEPSVIAQREKNLGEKPYVLAFGSSNPSKNTLGLLQAWQALSADTRDRVGLRVLLPEGLTVEAIWKAGACGDLPKGVECLQNPDDAELAELYRNARAFVMPSLAEGFGLPVLEAMACGAPIAVSDLPVFREIAGESAVYFDPKDPGQIARGLRSLLEDRDLQTRLSNAGRMPAREFTYERAAQVAERVFREVAERSRQRPY